MAKEIPLTQGQVTLVDDRDYDSLSQWKWRTFRGPDRRCYAARSIRRDGHTCQILMHREIAGATGRQQVDHRDNDGLNNQRENLRLCTVAQNQMNKRKSPGKSSRYKGVSWHKTKAKWLARIFFRGQQIILGYYKCEPEAGRAYDKAAIRYFGEFVRLNFAADE